MLDAAYLLLYSLPVSPGLTAPLTKISFGIVGYA